MRDLRLIGVHEDGQHLLLSDSEGERYRVELDEPLRVAARRDRARLGQLQIEIDGGMRPRDVQALIRAGLSSEEVADRAGWSVEKVRRYEGPILAEREHVAGLARGVRLRGRSGSQSSAPTLAARVSQRLAGRGVDPATAEWDSARGEDGDWTVLLTFPAGGRERQARWSFDVPARTVAAADDEARWLSEEDSSGTLPAPHLVSPPVRSSTVYDVEAEGGVASPGHRGGAHPSADDPVDLMSAMRERAAHRGRSRRRKSPAARTPLDEAPREDALPLEDIAYDPESMPPPPAARGTHPRDAEDVLPAADAEQPAAQQPDAQQPDAEQPAAQQPDAEQTDAQQPDAEQPAAHQPDAQQPDAELPAAQQPAVEQPDEPGQTPEAPAQERPTGSGRSSARPARRGARTRVPSWDDVMFGAKPHD